MINRILDHPSTSYSASKNGRSKPATPLVSSGDIREFVEPVENLILKYPAAALASAFAIGVVLAWWIKRK